MAKMSASFVNTPKIAATANETLGISIGRALGAMHAIEKEHLVTGIDQ